MTVKDKHIKYLFNVSSFPHLKVVCIEHARLCPTEEDGGDRDPGHQLHDGGVGLIFLWLCNPQQAGQETVPLMHLVTCRIFIIKMTIKMDLNLPV